MTNLGFLSVPLARTASAGTTMSTPTIKDAVGPPSTDVSITLGLHETANGHMSRDLGWMKTQQHDDQPIVMDVSWEPMQRSRLPVKIVNELNLPAVDREAMKPPEHEGEESQVLAMDREAMKS